MCSRVQSAVLWITDTIISCEFKPENRIGEGNKLVVEHRIIQINIRKHSSRPYMIADRDFTTAYEKHKCFKVYERQTLLLSISRRLWYQKLAKRKRRTSHSRLAQRWWMAWFFSPWWTQDPRLGPWSPTRMGTTTKLSMQLICTIKAVYWSHWACSRWMW